MSKVFVVDEQRTPLDPVHPGRARLLLSQGKAAVLRRFPFTIILKTTIAQPVVTPLRVKLDPGSKTTGIAVVNDTTGEVVFAAELAHRGGPSKGRWTRAERYVGHGDDDIRGTVRPVFGIVVASTSSERCRIVLLSPRHWKAG